MSWLFSRALGVESWPAICSDGEQSVPSSMEIIPQAYCSPDRMTELSRLSRYGMTFAPLTACRGAELLTSYLAGFRAKPIALPLRAKMLLMISGRKCGGSWQMSLPGTSLPRTFQSQQSKPQPTTSNRWVTTPGQYPFQRKTWALTTFGNGIGYLHTPTTKANYCADSMQKWPSARAFKEVFGRPSPEAHEWLMDWPEGWSDIRPLETGKFHAWQLRHLSPCVARKESA